MHVRIRLTFDLELPVGTPPPDHAAPWEWAASRGEALGTDISNRLERDLTVCDSSVLVQSVLRKETIDD